MILGRQRALSVAGMLVMSMRCRPLAWIWMRWSHTLRLRSRSRVVGPWMKT